MRTKCGQKGDLKKHQGAATKHNTLIFQSIFGGDEGI
jgi:hypothetical protein